MHATTLVLTSVLLPLTAAAQVLPPRDLPATTPEVEALITDLGFDESDRKLVLQGTIVSRDLAEGSDKELALTVAMLVPGPAAEVVSWIRRGETFDVATNVIAFKEITTDGGDEAFAQFDFDPYQSTEVSKLIRTAPGSMFNLSKAEFERIETARASFRERGAEVRKETQTALTDAYRAILEDRYTAYRRGGISAIAPYDRGGDEPSRPDRELAEAAAAATLLARRMPEFHRAFANYPRDAVEGVEHRFYWVKQLVQSRPAAVLSHRMFQITDDRAVIAERVYFVGQGYNSHQAIVACLPIETGTIVFYGGRTSTDSVAGGDEDVKHLLGRDRIRAKIVEHFRLARIEIEKQRVKESKPSGG